MSSSTIKERLDELVDLICIRDISLDRQKVKSKIEALMNDLKDEAIKDMKYYGGLIR